MEQVMQQDLSERIRERAYEIWIASGHRDGKADQHWLAAEQEILSSLRGRTELQIAFRTLLSAAGFHHWFRSAKHLQGVRPAEGRCGTLPILKSTSVRNVDFS